MSNKAYLEVRDRISTNLSTLQEGLEGVRVVQAFGRERRRSPSGSTGTNEDQYEANMETVRISAKYFPIIEYAGVVGTAVIVGYGGWLSTRGVVTVGTVAAFVLYLNSLFEPINQLSQLYNTVQSAGAALHKIFGVLDTRPSIRSARPRSTCPASGEIDVDDVTFAYGTNEPVLHDVTLHIADGERLALVGPTGAGKSTLAKLIARFYDPIEGAVRVGGVDLRDADVRLAAPARSSSSRRRASCSRGRCATTCASGGRKPPTPRSRSAARCSGCSTGSRRSPKASTPRCASAAHGCRPGSASSSRWPAPRSPIPSVLVLDEATSNLDPGTEHARRARDGAAHARPHRRRGRAPAVDRGPRRPHRRRATTAGSPSSVRTTSSSPTTATTPSSTAPGPCTRPNPKSPTSPNLEPA